MRFLKIWVKGEISRISFIVTVCLFLQVSYVSFLVIFTIFLLSHLAPVTSVSEIHIYERLVVLWVISIAAEELKQVRWNLPLATTSQCGRKWEVVSQQLTFDGRWVVFWVIDNDVKYV